MADVRDQVMSHITNQVTRDTAQHELNSLGPPELDWPRLVNHAVEYLVPELVRVCPLLVERIHDIFQGPAKLEKLLNDEAFALALASLENSNKKAHSKFIQIQNNAISLAKSGVDLVTTFMVAQQVTKVIEDFLPSPSSLGTSMLVNGSSMYPDLYLAKHAPEYSKLSPQRHKGGVIHGPCRNSKNQPSKVPDGLEVKTKKGVGGLRVDCHAPNPGLHMVVCWSTENKLINVQDVWLAYISGSDYTECARNTSATTVKYSFGQGPFISLLSGKKKNQI